MQIGVFLFLHGRFCKYFIIFGKQKSIVFSHKRVSKNIKAIYKSTTMKLKILFLILFISFSSIAQKSRNIDFVNFKYNASITAFSGVEISIYENRTYNKTTYKLEAKYFEHTKKKKKKIEISEEDFNKIIQSICKINNSDLVENFVSGLDGSTSELEFGTFYSNSIKFELWGVHKNQINSNLKDFIETIQLILEVAEIKIEDYN